MLRLLRVSGWIDFNDMKDEEGVCVSMRLFYWGVGMHVMGEKVQWWRFD